MTFKSPDKLAILIGPDGRWFHENSPEFLAHLGDCDPDYDATLFAVRNLGFVEFAHYDSRLVEITVHPRNVEGSTLRAVQNLVSLSRAELFIIKHFERSWKSEIASSARDAAIRMFQLCAASSGDRAPLTSTCLVEDQSDLAAGRGERRISDRAIADWHEHVSGRSDTAKVPAPDLATVLTRDSSYRFVLAISPVIENTVLLSYGAAVAKMLDLPPKTTAHLAMTKLIPTRFSEVFVRGCRAVIEQNAPARVEGEIDRDDGWRELFRAAFIPAGSAVNAGVRLALGAFNSRVAEPNSSSLQDANRFR
jgi:hypothetical protein